MSKLADYWNRPNPDWARYPSIALRILLGGLFIFSGLVKVIDAEAFLATIPLYGVPDWSVPFAILTPPLEIVLGLGLVLGVALRHVTLGTAGLLLFFSALLLVAISGGELESCGCFGAYLEMSPGWSLVRNIVLIIITLLIYRGHRSDKLNWTPRLGLITAGLMLLLGAATGYTAHAAGDEEVASMVGAIFPDEGYGDNAPSMAGEQLIFVFAVSCHHCWNAVANVNQLAAQSGFNVIAVTPNKSYEIQRFEREFQTVFPIYSLDQKTFFDTFPYWPMLYYVRDGIIAGEVAEVPALKTLREVHFAEWE